MKPKLAIVLSFLAAVTLILYLAVGRAPAPPAPPAPPSPDAPGPFSFASPERVKDVLGRAGFTAIALEPFTAPMLLGETLGHELADVEKVIVGEMKAADVDID